MAARTQKQTAVSKAVTSTVAPAAVITPPVATLVIDPKWREFGALDSQSEKSSSERIALIASMLKDAPYPVWIAFNAEYCAGAKEDGYANAPDSLSRRVTKPLALLGIVRPISETSTNARPKTAEQTAADEVKAKAKAALAAMTEADCDKEIAKTKDPVKLAELFGRKVAAHKAEEKTKAAATKAERVKLYNAIAEMLKPMLTSDNGKAELQAAHRAIAAIVAKSK